MRNGSKGSGGWPGRLNPSTYPVCLSDGGGQGLVCAEPSFGFPGPPLQAAS